MFHSQIPAFVPSKTALYRACVLFRVCLESTAFSSELLTSEIFLLLLFGIWKQAPLCIDISYLSLVTLTKVILVNLSINIVPCFFCGSTHRCSPTKKAWSFYRG